jgi:hypothetical protein
MVMEFDKKAVEAELREQYRLLGKADRYVGLATMRVEGSYPEMQNLIDQGLSEGEVIKKMLKLLERSHKVMNHPLFELKEYVDKLSNELRDIQYSMEAIELKLSELMK